MEELAEVTLTKDWYRRKAGQVLKVDKLRAEALVDSGMAVYGAVAPKKGTKRSKGEN